MRPSNFGLQSNLLSSLPASDGSVCRQLTCRSLQCPPTRPNPTERAHFCVYHQKKSRLEPIVSTYTCQLSSTTVWMLLVPPQPLQSRHRDIRRLAHRQIGTSTFCGTISTNDKGRNHQESRLPMDQAHLDGSNEPSST